MSGHYHHVVKNVSFLILELLSWAPELLSTPSIALLIELYGPTEKLDTGMWDQDLWASGQMILKSAENLSFIYPGVLFRRFYEGHLPVLVTSDVDIIEQVFVKQFENFTARKVRACCFGKDFQEVSGF